MFSIELISAWQSQGLIGIENQEAYLNEPPEALAEIQVPTNVQQIVTGRLERLTPDMQIMLKSASILGNEFAIGELSRFYPYRNDNEALVAMIGHLIELNLLERRVTEGKDVIGFANDFIREVASALLPMKMRKRLEQGVVQVEDEGR